ncbi:REP-associated tyrosine transposase [Mesobacillus maritimus]|uniref:Transposase n=1 Tax=Mesobacillus maritimus TaxID=1643336 RepID=A0ABS7K4X8_9BACI|nr:transposase [Mesobacillus maritimus]MBY0097311.1 transposase [Mesobacillus maritimus]
MSRPKRIFLPNRYYHVVCRGNRRDPLFRNVTDFEAMLYILHQLHEKYPFEITSYCFMTNHFHLQICSKEASLSKLMSLVNKRYANYYNTKYRITGHVFEKRFYDKLIEDKEGMLEVSRYIHLNPVAAKMVKQPEHYPWSSFHYYLNPHVVPLRFVQLNRILDYYEGTDREKRGKYCRSVLNKLEHL